MTSEKMLGQAGHDSGRDWDDNAGREGYSCPSSRSFFSISFARASSSAMRASALAVRASASAARVSALSMAMSISCCRVI